MTYRSSSSVMSESVASINNQSTVEPLESLVIRFGDVTIEKNRQDTIIESTVDSHQAIFHELELLNSTRSSAVKDRILRRLLHRVRIEISTK